MNRIKQILEELNLEQEQSSFNNLPSVKTKLSYLAVLEKIVIDEFSCIIKLQTEQSIISELLTFKQKVITEVSKLELKLTVKNTDLKEKVEENFSNLLIYFQENLSIKNLNGLLIKSKSQPELNINLCHSCKGTHSTLNCPKLKELSAIGRTTFANNKKLCYQCLEKHNKNECKMSKCMVCNHAHHISLCWKMNTDLNKQK